MGWVKDNVFTDSSGATNTPLAGALGLPSAATGIQGLTGELGAEAAMHGAELQHDAALQGIAAEKEFFNIMRGDLRPYTRLGGNAINGLRGIAGSPNNLTSGLVDPNQVFASPGFQFQLNEGFEQIRDDAAARGRSGAPGTLKALEQYRQGLASTFVPQYQNQLMQLRDQQFRENVTQDQNRFNQLFEIGRLGQSSAAQTAAGAGQTGSAISSLLGQAGNAMAAGGMGAAQSYGMGAQNMVGLAGLFANIFGGAGGAAAAACDRRFKENIEEVGVDDDGLTMFKWNYIGDDQVYIGKMADDILEVDPDNVLIDENGYLFVTQKYAPQRVVQ